MDQRSRLGALFTLALATLSACGGEPLAQEEAAPAAARQSTIDVVPVPLELAPLAMTGVLFYDAATAAWTTITKTNGAFTWPSPYDVPPASHVHYTFEPAGSFTSAEVLKLSARTGYALEVYLNGVKLPEAQVDSVSGFYTTTSDSSIPEFGCPAGDKCLTVSVPGARAFTAPFGWDLKLVYWKTPVRLGGLPDKTTIHGYVKGPTSSQSYFAAKIAPIFQHGNCSTCHALGSKQKLVDHHQGLLSLNQITSTATDHGHQLRCGGGCHGYVVAHAVPGKTFGETEWMVPDADMDIDWTGRTISQICNRVKQNLTTVAKMEKHFFDDARIAWAVHSGALPNGRPNKGTAPPHDYYTFETLMKVWIEGGQPCP